MKRLLLVLSLMMAASAQAVVTMQNLVVPSSVAAGAAFTVYFEIKAAAFQSKWYMAGMTEDTGLTIPNNTRVNLYFSTSAGNYPAVAPVYWQPSNGTTAGTEGASPAFTGVSISTQVPADCEISTIVVYVWGKESFVDSGTFDAALSKTVSVTGIAMSPLRLNLESWNPGQSTTQYKYAGRITNYGDWPQEVANMTVTHYFRDTAATTWSTASFAANQSIYTVDNTLRINLGATTNTITEQGSVSDCGSSRTTNYTNTFSWGSEASTVRIPGAGGYMQSNCDTCAFGQWNKSGFPVLDYTDDYSRSGDLGTSIAGRGNNQFFDLFYTATQVCEYTSVSVQDTNTGLVPCNVSACAAPTPTPTPGGGSGPPSGSMQMTGCGL